VNVRLGIDRQSKGRRGPSRGVRQEKVLMHTEGGANKKRTIQVRISRGEHQFVAECLDLPVVTQASTLDELTENIREAIGLHLEGEDLAALGLATNPTILATLELEAVA
jgi:predicted RNase H-like HicB family nuclease